MEAPHTHHGVLLGIPLLDNSVHGLCQKAFRICTEKGGLIKGCQPYLKDRASQKASLCRLNPWRSIGSATSWLEDPFSLAISINLWCAFGKSGQSRLASASYAFLFFFGTSDLEVLWCATVEYSNTDPYAWPSCPCFLPLRVCMCIYLLWMFSPCNVCCL